MAATAAAGDARAFGPVQQIAAGVRDVGYADVAPPLAAAGYRVLVPYLRGYGAPRYLSGDAPRNGQQSVLAVDAIALLDTLGVHEAVVGGFDWGARTANVMAALWPERCRAMVSVSGYLIGSQAAGQAPLPPAAEQEWWYQYYFATERGRAGYEAYRHDFARLIWRSASPAWRFDDATFERSAAAFDNPDHVAVVIHNYRWRIGLAAGEPELDMLEQRLAAFPPIAVPTITLEGDANGAPHPEPADYAARFTGKYLHRTRTPGRNDVDYIAGRSTRRSAVIGTTYLGSGDASKHRRDYRPEWLDNLADDVTMEGSVLTGIAEGPEAIRAILGFARTLYDYQEFNFVGPYGDHGFVEDYTSMVRGEPIGSVVVIRFNEAGQAARIVVNHRPLRSVLLWSQLMGEHFAGTRYAKYFLSHEAAEGLHEAMGTR